MLYCCLNIKKAILQLTVKLHNKESLKDFLNEKAEFYEKNWFIEHDPIQIPHRFSKKEDIEISGFLAATIAWGQRKTIINNASKLMDWMDNSPHEFILNHQESDLQKMEGFVHRTFNSDDLLYFIHALKNIYTEGSSLEELMLSDKSDRGASLHQFKTRFFQYDHLKRTEKHLPDPLKKSSAKRMNMFIRWMVRSADNGVDFGIWKAITPADLYIPLDVHTGNVGRKLGLLKRKQNDWQAVEELTQSLRKFDIDDPIKYDFALFGIGAHEKGA